MKKIIIALTFALLSLGSAMASPQFKGLSNRHGKTTIKIEFTSSDFSQVTVIKDWVLHNDGKEYNVKKVNVKKVNVKGSKGYTFVLEFQKLTEFSNCSLSYSVNGEPANIDIQSLLLNR